MNWKFIPFFFFLLITFSFSYSQYDIDKYKVVINDYPEKTPSYLEPDAPLTGNGDIALTMRASRNSVRFYIGKNDFWRFIPSYPLGNVLLPGGFDIESELISKGKYSAEELPGSAEIHSIFDAGNNGVLKVDSWVAATDNKIVIEVESTVKTQIRINLWAQTGGMGKVTEGSDGKCRWVTRSFEDIPLLERETHIAMCINKAEGYLQLQPGHRETIIITAYTNFDTPAWKEKAISEASGFSSVENLKDEHHKWWNDFWKLSHVTLSDSFLEQYYYMSQYFFACSSRKGKFAPGLYSPFITMDNNNWSSDYHLNYNYQAPYWDSFSSNHIDLTDNYDAPLLACMDKCRVYAEKMHGARGVNYPVGIGPMGLISSAWADDGYDHTCECGAMFWHQKTNASFAAANMLMRFYSTYDEDYARKVYPFVLACADFWEDYLVFDNGRYQVKNDIMNETIPWVEREDSNSVTSLGLVKMTMRGAIDMSEFLGVDKGRRKKWNDIINKLYPYPMFEKENGELTVKSMEGEDARIARDVDYRIIMHGTILPAGVTGPILDPEFNKVMLSDIAEWEKLMNKNRDWGNSLGNGFETAYAGAVRAGYPARDVIKFMKDRINRMSHPNFWVSQGGGGIETFTGVPLTVNEMLMQSFEHVIRIFPNWDRTLDASFENLRAYGAFLVSSSVKGGQIGAVKILSEKGRICKLENPWPGRSVKVSFDGSAPRVFKGNVIEFKTSVNQSIEIYAD